MHHHLRHVVRLVCATLAAAGIASTLPGAAQAQLTDPQANITGTFSLDASGPSRSWAS